MHFGTVFHRHRWLVRSLSLCVCVSCALRCRVASVPKSVPVRLLLRCVPSRGLFEIRIATSLIVTNRFGKGLVYRA
uniref:Putative secreted protein n=1 Tax=Anopheles darlingi TaxID=43151 RepID=A0A2M4DHC5_ANODA